MANLDLEAAATLDTLTERLTRHGVTFPGLDKHRELTAALTPRAEPTTPDNLLQRTPDELHQYAQKVALHRVLSDATKPEYLIVLTALRSPLNAALRETIRDNSSDIIAQLRPAFDRAADVMRKAVALGVKPGDDLRSLFEADKPVRTAWLSSQTHARTLDDILTTRQQLSVVAGVQPAPEKLGPNQPPGGTGINWSMTVTTPGSGAGLDVHNPNAPWQRWLAIAEHLELVDPAGVTAWDSFSSSSAGLAQALTAEAQRRHDQDRTAVSKGLHIAQGQAAQSVA